jgi:hypothetical protein
MNLRPQGRNETSAHQYSVRSISKDAAVEISESNAVTNF